MCGHVDVPPFQSAEIVNDDKATHDAILAGWLGLDAGDNLAATQPLPTLVNVSHGRLDGYCVVAGSCRRDRPFKRAGDLA